MPWVVKLLDRLGTGRFCFYTGFNQGLLADSLIYRVQGEIGLLHSVRVGLTANPKKYVIGWREVRYMGYHLGGGEVHPQLSKTDAVAACLQPETKKQVRAFLGMAGYYR